MSLIGSCTEQSGRGVVFKLKRRKKIKKNVRIRTRKLQAWRKEMHKCPIDTYGTVRYIDHVLNMVSSERKFFAMSVMISRTKNPNYWRSKIGL